jgi:hypothetical protein
MSFFGLSALRWLAPGCALAVVACTSSASSVEVRTDGRLRVLPPEFTAEVGCSFASGDSAELSYYAATLIDLGLSPDAETEGEPTDDRKYPRTAGSGVAARCTSTTTFSTTASNAASNDGLIEVDHIYAAIVDGYAGSQLPDVKGERSAKNWSAPAWQWLCGIGGLDETQLDTLVTLAQNLTITQYVPPASDAGDALALSAELTDAAAEPMDAGAVAKDAGATATESSDASSSGPFDAAATVTPREAGTAAAEAGAPRDWRAELSSAAKGEFAPPPKVVSGGQSGVRGCVPLF